jgi:DNA-binding SARP family transcriptional activator
MAIEACQTAVLFDPLSEMPYCRLMRLHAERGNLGEALLVYKNCRKVLSLRLNAVPGRETTALYRSIRDRLAPSPRSVRDR